MNTVATIIGYCVMGLSSAVLLIILAGAFFAFATRAIPYFRDQITKRGEP